MRNHPGLKAWSTVPAMLFSLALISGCNEETPTPASNPTPATPPPVVKPVETPKKVGEATPPPPSTPKAEEKNK